MPAAPAPTTITSKLCAAKGERSRDKSGAGYAAGVAAAIDGAAGHARTAYGTVGKERDA
jgi:hypothetical protein